MKRTIVNILIGILIGVITYAIANYTYWFDNIELGLYNTRFELRGERAVNPDIVIVSVDDSSIEEMGAWPWPRSIHAEMIRKLNDWGAKAIGFDIIFSQPSINPKELVARLNELGAKITTSSLPPNNPYDMDFAAALKESDNIVLASMFTSGDYGKVSSSSQKVEEAESYTSPYWMFANATNYGVANYKRDMDNQMRFGQLLIPLNDLPPTSQTVNGKYEPHFVLQMLKKVNPDLYKKALDKYKDDIYWINFAGEPKSYKTISYVNVYDETLLETNVKSYAELFKDKIVFIGATAEILHDTFPTPFADRKQPMPGVEIHANALDTIMKDISYNPVEPYQNDIIIIVIAILTSVGLLFLRPIGGFGCFLGIIILYSVFNVYLFTQHRLWLDWFSPIVASFFTYTGTYAYRFLIEEKEQRRVKKFFKSYVSPQLVEELLKDPKNLPSLKSERRIITCLFSDIAGFTSMSERLPPDEVEHILNEYLTAMTTIVFENGGTLDKYVGDAVMAVYGNVGQNNPANDASKAVNTAIQMQAKLMELRQKWLQEGKVPMQIRIGLNTGEALVGNFGSPQKMDYTVIGDTVNVASRLEGLNKEFSTNIMMSQYTYDLVKDHVQSRALGPAPVKGKSEAISVYEVIGWKEDDKDIEAIKQTRWIKGSEKTQWR